MDTDTVMVNGATVTAPDPLAPNVAVTVATCGSEMMFAAVPANVTLVAPSAIATEAGIEIGHGDSEHVSVNERPLLEPLPIGASTVTVPIADCVLPPTIVPGVNDNAMLKGLTVTVPEALVPNVAVMFAV